MPHDRLIGLAGVLFLGAAAQWLGWRLRLPAILMLLLAGLAAGPIAGVLSPDELLGETLMPIVSLSVALILFEGGLSLELRELRQIGGPVRNLVTVGALVTWALATLLARSLLDFDWALALLLGAILVVTGPTVIIPLLRHVRPAGKVGAIAKWEGILIDPIGALLAVLVFEAILAGGLSGRLEGAALQFISSIFIGSLTGLAFAGAIVLLFAQHWVPDFLQNLVSLSMVVGAFTASNEFQAESGLVAVTVMGVALANQRYIAVKHLLEFKENLRVLLISSLFILLAARIEREDLDILDWRMGLFLAGLFAVVRPASVWLSTLGSDLTKGEKIFLCGMAPRGIVAAAVSALFASRLAQAGNADAERLAPITFLVIIATVSIYGLTAFPLARRLNLAEPSPQGVFFMGAHDWARKMAQALHEAGFRVVLADSDWENVSEARLEGLEAYFGGILSQRVLDRANLYGIGRLFAVTSNEEANSLATVHFADVFGAENVYQLSPHPDPNDGRSTVSLRHLTGRILFSAQATYGNLSERFERGATIKTTRLTKQFDYNAFRLRYGETALPLFLVTEAKKLMIVTADREPKPRAGQTLIALVDPSQPTSETHSELAG